jgi:hypothetical protein
MDIFKNVLFLFYENTFQTPFFGKSQKPSSLHNAVKMKIKILVPYHKVFQSCKIFGEIGNQKSKYSIKWMHFLGQKLR